MAREDSRCFLTDLTPIIYEEIDKGAAVKRGNGDFIISLFVFALQP